MERVTIATNAMEIEGAHLQAAAASSAHGSRPLATTTAPPARSREGQQDASAEEARGARFFGVEPTKFIDDCCNMIDDYISDGLDVLEGSIVKKAKGDVTKEEVAACVKNLQKRYRAVCDSNYDKFEVYLKRNILAVPEWAEQVSKQTEDAACAAPSSAAVSAEEAALDEELARVERELRHEAREARALEQRLSESASRLRRGANKIQSVSFLRDTISLADIDDLVAQARELEPRVKHGRKVLGQLAASEATDSQAAEPRRPALEGVSLEEVRGLNARLFANISNQAREAPTSAEAAKGAAQPSLVPEPMDAD